MRIIMHVDMDSFFAACEELRRPELKGKPVVVGADPKEGKGRGVVSTANYAARKYGIRSGMPISLAYRKCPNAVYLRPDFEYYEKISEKIMSILRAHADAFEEASIDEAYLDVSSQKSFKAAELLAVKIKAEIFKRTKLTCSIGLGPNKLIAKMASDYQKPNGLTVVQPKDVQNFIRPLPVRKLLGVGPKTESALAEMKIKTIGDLQKCSKAKLIQAFGRAYGEYLYEAARGIDESPIIEEWEPKSFCREHTFEKDTRKLKLIHKTFDELIKDLHQRLIDEKKKFRTLTVIVRYEDFEQHSHARTLRAATNDLVIMRRLTQELFKPFYLRTKKLIRKIGVRVSNFA